MWIWNLNQNRGFANHDNLDWSIQKAFYFLFKIFKMFKTNIKLTTAACWIYSKINNKDNRTTLVAFLCCCLYYWSLLCCIFWKLLVLWNFESWRPLNSTFQIQLALLQCDSFFINNQNITANSVEKHLFVVLNVKLQVRIRLTFRTVTCTFHLEHHYLHGMCLLKIFAHTRNKRVI